MVQTKGKKYEKNDLFVRPSGLLLCLQPESIGI
jgi:hypothetical protein